MQVEDVAVADIGSSSAPIPVINRALRPILESLPPPKLRGRPSVRRDEGLFPVALYRPELAQLEQIVVQPKDFQPLPIIGLIFFTGESLQLRSAGTAFRCRMCCKLPVSGAHAETGSNTRMSFELLD